MPLTRKSIVLLVAFLIVGFVTLIVFNFYQSKLISEKTEETFEYWSNAIESARNQRQTVPEFVEQHSERAVVIYQESNKAHLKETVRVETITCSEWTMNISYSWSGGDSARSSLLTGKCSF